MQEEIKQEESLPASSSPSADEGKPDSDISQINPIEEAKQILEQSKRVLEETKRERVRIEKATAEMLINGRSYAGQAPPRQETPDEKWAREAKIRYAGTGMCPC